MRLTEQLYLIVFACYFNVNSIFKAFILGMKVSRKKLDPNGLLVSGRSRISQQREAPTSEILWDNCHIIYDDNSNYPYV